MEQQRRLTRCANSACNDSFSFSYPKHLAEDAELVIKTQCPFCSTPLTINLSEYTKRTIVSYKQGAQDKQMTVLSLDLPDTLPTQKATINQ